MSAATPALASAPAPDNLQCSMGSCSTGKGFEVYQALIFFSPILCILILTMSFCYCYLRRQGIFLQRYPLPQPFQVFLSAAPGNGGLPPALLDSFPTMPFLDIEMADPSKESPETTCPVCLAEYGPTDILRKLPCHAFHVDCIDAWLAHHSTCPICRTVLMPVGEAAPVGEVACGQAVPGQDVEMVDVELVDNERVRPSGGSEASATVR